MTAFDEGPDDWITPQEPKEVDDWIPEAQPSAWATAGKAAGETLATSLIAGPLQGIAVAEKGRGQDYANQEEVLRRIQAGEDIQPAIEAVQANPPAPQPVTQNPLYRAGEAVRREAAEEFPMTPEERTSWPGTLASTAAGMAGPVAATLLGGVPGMVVAAGQMALSSAGDTFEAAIAKGASEEDAAKAAGLSALIAGGIGSLPLGVVLSPIKQVAPGLMGWAAGKLAQAGANGITFAIVGEAQTWLESQVAQAYYDKDAGYSPDIKRMLASVIVGGGFGMLHPLTQAKPEVTPAPGEPAPSAETVDSNPPPSTPPVDPASLGVRNDIRAIFGDEPISPEAPPPEVPGTGIPVADDLRRRLGLTEPEETPEAAKTEVATAQEELAPQAPRAPSVPKNPLSISQFIARNGGLELTDETRAKDYDKVFVPGAGPLARKSGLSIDGFWRQKLMEEGYLPYDPDGYSSRDIRDELHDALHADLTGNKFYSENDRGRIEDIANQEAQLPNVESAAQEILDAHAKEGISADQIDTKSLYEAAELLASGQEKDPISALERAYLAQDDHYAAKPQGPRETGAPTAGEGEQGARPGPQEAPSGIGENRPSAGENGQTPQVEPGFTRFYHGGSGGLGAVISGGGRWVTQSLEYARNFRSMGEPNEVYYVDIPNDSPLLKKSYDDTGTDQVAPFVNFEAPEEIARNLKPLREAAATELTAAGEQHVIPGAEPIGQGEQAQIGADKPIKPTVAQKPPDVGMFGDEANQTDLLDAIKAVDPILENTVKEAGDAVAAVEGVLPEQPAQALSDHFKDYFLSDPAFMQRNAGYLPDGRFNTGSVRKFAKDAGFTGTVKEIEEQIEFGAVKAARVVANRPDLSPNQKFSALVEMYDRMPKLATRTSTSMRDQAFSTPTPLAYLASQLSRVSGPRPPAPGDTRLLRVEPAQPQTGSISQWVRESPEFQEMIGAHGRWFAADQGNVDWYVQHLHNDGIEPKVTYVDVPTAYVEQYRVSNIADPKVRSFSRRPEEEFFLPRGLADDRKDLTPTVYEPTAGNGALLLEARPPEATANELNPGRAQNLREQGFKVTERDAADPGQGRELRKEGGVDRVMANPPFGAVKEGPESKIFDLSDIQRGYRTHEIDHAIALRALEAMKDDGRATLILGGLNKLIRTQEGRSDGYNSKAKREFFKTLYDNYNVTDHFTVAGELYERQGAGWPVDVISIDGRGKSARRLPAVDVPRIYNSWDELGGLLNDAAREDAESPNRPVGGTPTEDPAIPAAVPDEGVRPTDLGGGDGDWVAPGGESEGVRSGSPPDESVNDTAGGDGDRESGQPKRGGEPVRPDLEIPPERPPSRLEGENENQTTYQPQSRDTKGLDTLAPVNLSKPMADSLRAVERRHGDVDKFVARELGYKPEELKYNFGAEQVDALALALDNIKRGKGFIIGDQCVAGETRIYNPLTKCDVRIDELAKKNAPHAILALTSGGFEAAAAVFTFKKGQADLYRVTLQDGRNITVTKHHRFLTPQGWASLSDGVYSGTCVAVAQGEDTNFLSIRGQDALRCFGKPQDSLCRYSSDSRPYGEPPLSEAKTDPEILRLQADAFARILASSHGGDPAPSLGHSHPYLDVGRHSKRNSSPSESRVRAPIASHSASCVEKLTALIPENASQSLLESCVDVKDLSVLEYQPSSYEKCSKGAAQSPLVRVDNRLPQKSPHDLQQSPWLSIQADIRSLFLPTSSSKIEASWLPVSSIEFVRHDEFYDMYVPCQENYVAEGFVNHNTGIGKGRVNAAVIRWAIKNGRIPIFVTEKPGLYGDIYRDLTETGFQHFLGGREPRFLMTNAGERVPLDEDGKFVLKTGEPKDHNQLLSSLPTNAEEFLKDHDMVLTTYNQMQTTGEKETARRDFLRKIAPNAVLIMDESHNAGGQAGQREIKGKPQNRSGFARELVNKANGVFYSSATYAKRPDVMDLYSATDMSMAVADPKDLGEAIAKGGVPMQQAVASMLARAGQYVRRERSFKGIDYATPTVPVDREMYDGVSKSLSQIQKFSEYIKTVAKNIDDDLKGDASGVGYDNSTGDAGAKSLAFTSIMHNIVNQMLLAMKAKPAAEMAIESLKKGEKPVITVSGTMESFLKDYAENMGIKHGDAFAAGFDDVLKKYLDRTRTLIIKKPFAKKGETERKYLTDSELGPVGRALYAQTKKMIDSLDLKDLKVSPIDAIKDEIQKAGYKVGEITGRGNIIDYSGKYPTYKARPGREVTTRGRRETIGAFNSGDYDALVLNQSGSTGLSIHAGEKFKDQRPRHMIVAQPEGNIDTHMQLLGRINRTGQTVLPRYSQLVADIPAEKRPAAVLAKKMASLNANTTGIRGSAVTAKDVPDFLNVYGDMVAGNMIAENPELNAKLGNPVKMKDNGGLDAEDAMRKVTGRIPLLPLKEQEALYQHLETEYKALLDQMKAAGENALEAQTMDLQAKTTDSREVVPRKTTGGDSPFAEPVTAYTMSVRRLGRPFKSSEVVGKVFEGIDHEAPKDVTQENALKHLKDLNDHNTPNGKRVEQFRLKQGGDALRNFADYKRGVIDDLDTPERQEAERVKLDAVADRWANTQSELSPGTRITLKTSNGNLTGIVTGVEQKGKPKNPLALSTWKVHVAIADATRQITLPFSRLWPDGRSDPEDQFAIEYQPLQDWLETPAKTLDRFDSQQAETREDRTMLTGNMLAAYDWLNRKGRIVNYTDENGQVNQGILAPRDFDLGKHASEKQIAIEDPNEVRKWIQDNPSKTLNTTDNAVAIKDSGSGYATISIDGSKRTGGKYFLDRGLTDITGDFTKRSGRMSVEIGPSRVLDAISKLQELGVKFAAAPKEEKTVKADFAEAPKGKTQEKPRPADEQAIKLDDGTYLYTKPAESYSKKAVALANALDAIAQRLAPQATVRGASALRMDNRAIRGVFVNNAHYPQFIAWSLETVESRSGAAHTLRHEVIHHLKNAGLIRPEEWDVLSKAALDNDWLSKYKIDERYPDESMEHKIEEAVAEHFGQWQKEPSIEKYGLIQRAFNRIEQFRRQVGAAVRRIFGQDVIANDIFQKINTGEVGNRTSPQMAHLNEYREAVQRAKDKYASEQQPPKAMAGEPPLPEDAPRGSLTGYMRDKASQFFDMWRLIDESPLMQDLYKKVTPMAAGTNDSRRIAKNFANASRRAKWMWQKADEYLEKNFTPEQRKAMWEAADEESVARQQGQPTDGIGLSRLSPEERGAVEELQNRAQKIWEHAKALGMVEGEGLPSYTPRMVVKLAGDVYSKVGKEGWARKLWDVGRNIITSTGQMKHRKYLTTEETEAAARAKFGDDATVVKDIRTLSLAASKLEEAVAGRSLIENIREIGKRTGDPIVSDEGIPAGTPHKWFTIENHPAFWKSGPRFGRDPTTGAHTVVRDSDGNIQFDRRPIYVRDDFEGPLRSVMTEGSGPIYKAFMSLKAKAMSVIMYSPLLHNAVELSRALPAMPGRVAGLRVYFEGNAARRGIQYEAGNHGNIQHILHYSPLGKLLGTARPEPRTSYPDVSEAINAGLVPIGKRFFNQDITDIMNDPNVAPGRSWTAKLAAAVPGLFDPRAGDAVKRAVDKMGDFWHNTLLWDRIADLQMGLYIGLRDQGIARGLPRRVAAIEAAHMANRYAGALPMESMSNNARKIANFLMFSRTFTLGNKGVIKDAIKGMPRDLQAQIEHMVGPDQLSAINSRMRRQSQAIVAVDIGLFLLGNAILQSAVNVMLGDKTIGDEAQEYLDRLNNQIQKVKDHPLQALNPLGWESRFEGLLPSSENEPGKQDKVLVGYQKDGTAIYMKAPTGKIGEEFLDTINPIKQFRSKMGTIAKPIFDTMANDKGFGQHIYNPQAEGTGERLEALGDVAKYFIESQLPMQSLQSAANLVTGKGDQTLNTLQVAGPVAGLMFSKGAPSGPEMGEVFNMQDRQRFQLQRAMPDITNKIQSGDIEGAVQIMNDIKVKPDLIKYIVKITLNPASRMTKSKIQNIQRMGTPEEQQRIQQDLARQPRAAGGRVEAKNIAAPTPAQAKAGNYGKDHVNIQGLGITIENAKGTYRSGVDKNGKIWKCKIPEHYGYIKKTEGADGDHIDCYLGPHIRSPHVYIVDQLDADTKKFDEHKAFIGFPSKFTAINAYHAAFNDGKAGARFGHVQEMTMDQFKEWLKGDTTKPVRYKVAA